MVRFIYLYITLLSPVKVKVAVKISKGIMFHFSFITAQRYKFICENQIFLTSKNPHRHIYTAKLNPNILKRESLNFAIF